MTDRKGRFREQCFGIGNDHTAFQQRRVFRHKRLVLVTERDHQKETVAIAFGEIRQLLRRKTGLRPIPWQEAAGGIPFGQRSLSFVAQKGDHAAIQKEANGEEMSSRRDSEK